MPKKKKDVVTQYIDAIKHEWARQDRIMAEFKKRFREKKNENEKTRNSGSSN